MPKTFRPKISADEIAEKASRGEDVSAYFTNRFTVVRPVRRVNVDLTPGMLRQLDERAARHPNARLCAGVDRKCDASAVGRNPRHFV